MKNAVSTSGRGNDISAMSVRPDRVICISAAGNYLIILTINDDNSLRQSIVRCTMKHAQAALTHNFVRCHRSYIVNIDYVIAVVGDMRSMKIILYRPYPVTLPVSVEYRHQFLELRKSQIYRRDG